MLLLTQTDRTIRAHLADQLADVESRFATELISDLPCVNSLVTHVERYRGKMLRPTLVLVSGLATAEAPGRPSEPHRVLATVVEMVHVATLVHDDVLDEATIRRRGDTVNRLNGNEVAVMLGDYLISHAYHLCSSLGNPTVSRIIADATNTVCEGELLQLDNRDNWNLDERTYFEIIRRKTASLCGTCCKLAVMLNDSPDTVADALYDYGEKLGIAFQIVDDLLDLIGSEDTVGKTLGRDLQKGKLTLPLIHHLTSADAPRREKLHTLLRDHAGSVRGDGDGPDNGRALAIRDLLSTSGSVGYARDRAARLVNLAKAALENLADGPARTLLADVADAVLTRKY
ncbi:MAG: polyprenyl synthetase family protein [Phycisphaeraceae bacterium]